MTLPTTMPAIHHVPTLEDAGSLLTDLLGVEVTASNPDPMLTGADVLVATEMLDDADELVGAVVCDYAFAVYAGASLAMVNPTVVAEKVEARDFPTNYFDNLKEVVNVLSGLFNTPDTPHVRLGNHYQLPGEMDVRVADLLARPTGRRDALVSIAGYGAGRVSWFLL